MKRLFELPDELIGSPLPPPAVLHSDLLEARELADDVATMLDELLYGDQSGDEYDSLTVFMSAEECLHDGHDEGPVRARPPRHDRRRLRLPDA